MSNIHVWRAAQERLRHQMTRAQFETWLRGTWLATAGDGSTTLCVRTTFARELLETRFRERIEAAIAEVTGQPCMLHVAVAADGPLESDPSGERSIEMGVEHTHGAHLLARGASQHHRHIPDDEPGLFDDAGDEPLAGPTREMEHLLVRRVTSLSSGRRRGSPVGRHVRAAVERARAAEAQPLEAVRAEEEGFAPDAPGDAVTDDVFGRENEAAEAVYLGEQRADRRESRSSKRRDRIDGMIRMSAHEGMRDERESDQWERAGFQPEQSPTPSSGERSGMDGDAQTFAYSGPPLHLNSRYTFSTFIVGSGNQLAHAASQAVAEAPGLAYNPLFLYGGVGLGKTHLLHAIGHKAIEHGLIVLYVSSETFTNEIVNAIRYRTTEEFRAKYRSVDVLLVDDIQFIAGKDSTEEEFFHTFNSLHENSKQIVICSDRPPKAIVSLAERLRSRFEWGLIADIQPPDLETRVAILRAKADVMRRQVPDDVITYLASRVQSNIRELEGSFNRLLAFSELQHLPLIIDTAKAALASLAADGRQRRVSVAEVLGAVAEHYRVSSEDLCGKQRDKHIVVPRQVAMYLMRQETEASLLEIGQALGGRDHSTVLHGCEKIGREVNDNTTLRKEVMAIRQQLLG